MRMCWVRTGRWSTPFTQCEGASMGAIGLGLVWYNFMILTILLILFPSLCQACSSLVLVTNSR